MQKDIRVSTPQSNQKKFGLVNQGEDFGYKEIFPYQKYLMASVLWTTKDSVLRIIPGNDGVDLYNQVINTDRYTEDGDQTEYLSDTFYMTQTVTRFGESAYSLCANLKPGTDDAARYPESPISYFSNTISRIMRAVQQGKTVKARWNDKWRAWTNMGGILTYPKPTLFFQAVCVQINGRPCKGSSEEDAQEAPIYGVVGINHKQSIQDLLKALVEPMNKRKPWSPDNSDFGALAEAEGNVLYLNSKVDTEGKKFLKASLASSDVPVSKAEPQSYPVDVDTCKKLWIPWNKVFKYLTVKEQLELLANEFGADTVNYVFSLNSIWKDLDMPERIRAVGMGSYGTEKRSSISVPPSFNPPNTWGKSTTIEDTETSVDTSTPSVDMTSIQEELKKIKAATGKNKPANLMNELMQELDDSDLNG